MYSVTNRIKGVKQPYGGYIPTSMFKIRKFDSDKELNQNENLRASMIGLVVDNLVRFKIDSKNAFDIAIKGAKIAEAMKSKKYVSKAQNLLKHITSIDDNKSIINACKLVSFDCYLRSPLQAFLYDVTPDDVRPDLETIENIKELTERCLKFFDVYGPITKTGFTFEEKGYTEVVSSGDGDYLTDDTLIDLKVSKKKINKDQKLQVAMYYIMGKHSKQEIYRNVKKVGIFNPRLNIYYECDMTQIDKDIIEKIEYDVICYKKKKSKSLVKITLSDGSIKIFKTIPEARRALKLSWDYDKYIKIFLNDGRYKKELESAGIKTVKYV